MPARSIHLLLYVRDTAQAATFYKLLGFKPVSRGLTANSFIFGTVRISLVNEKKIHPALRRSGGKASRKGQGVYFYLLGQKVDTLYKKLTAAGVKLSHAPKNWPWGYREFVVKDLDGYHWVIAQRL